MHINEQHEEAFVASQTAISNIFLRGALGEGGAVRMFTVGRGWISFHSADTQSEQNVTIIIVCGARRPGEVAYYSIPSLLVSYLIVEDSLESLTDCSGYAGGTEMEKEQ